MRPRPEWIPIRWPGGPHLQPGKSESDPARRFWLQPEALDLLRNTPFNCLIVDWAATRPASAQLQPFAEAARRRGLHLVGAIDDAVPEPADEAAAHTAGLDGLVAPQVKGTWPGVTSAHATDGAASGPTGAPWIDSNGWAIRLAEARQPGARPWVWFDPPAGQLLRPESFQLAVADAEAFGGRWVVSLTAALLTGLPNRQPEPMAILERLAQTASFFEMHTSWQPMRTRAALGIVSDFAGPNQTTAEEVLNLSTRRGLHYRILLKDKALALGFRGLKALLYVDEQPPEPALARALLDFARSGGMLITGHTSAGFLPKLPSDPLPNRRYDVGPLGRGRVAVAHSAADFEDPFFIACDTQLLLSYRNDPIRFWNYGAICWHFTSSPAGHSLLHVVNFSANPGNSEMGLIVREPYRTARLHRLGDARPMELKIRSQRVGIEFPLPPVSVYAAVELGR
jgi:hypothetical protein